MGNEKLKKTQQSKAKAPTRVTGSGDAPTQIPTRARHIGPRQHDLGISGGYLAPPSSPGAFTGQTGYSREGTLNLDLFREFSDASAKWEIKLHEKGPAGKVLLATFKGTTNFNGHYLKLDEFKPEHTDLPASRRCLLPIALSRQFRYPGEGPQGFEVFYVPLEGHQDFPNESWTILVHCVIDDGAVHEEDDDSVHVYIDWPKGGIVYPMLGAPALVSTKDHWLEHLVALDRPLALGAEKFLLKTMLRIFRWEEAAPNQPERQKAIRKRTFKLADPEDWFDFRHFKFADVGTDAKDATGKAESDDTFTLRLGQMDHFCLAEQEFIHIDAERMSVAAKNLHKPRSTTPITVPALSWRRDAKGAPTSQSPPKASDLHLYKVRAKLEGKGPGLYDLVWMNEDDFKAANTAVIKNDHRAIQATQDVYLRATLHAMSVGAHGHTAIDGRVLYKCDGKPLKGDPWEPTVNRLEKDDPASNALQSHHPVYVFEDKGSFKLGHLTDLHLDVRLDIMAQNPLEIIPSDAGADVATPALGTLVNNYNATFTALARTILDDSDALVLTGDLIDYNRGFSISPDGDVNASFVWKLGITSDKAKGEKKAVPRYRRERNWVHFYQILMRLYNEKQKPIFTTLGNHDYRPNPYSVYPGAVTPWGSFSVYPTIGGDLNLTLLEVAACYGPLFSSWTPTGTALGADAASIDNETWSVRWYHYAINGWNDYAVVAGKASLLMMDWDLEESVVSKPKGSFLPRAKYFMTKTQLGIYARWRDSAPPCKVLCCHPTLVCNGLAVGVTNAAARARPHVLNDLTHGTMGARAPVGLDSPAAHALRVGISSDVASGKVSLVITGHSHMDGIYAPSPDGQKVTMTHPTDPVWGKEMTFPSDVTNRILVTNCGGPLGEFTEARWTRRSRPSGSLFTLSGSSIKMKHVASERKQANPRRCVHDSERERVKDGRFYCSTTLAEVTSLGPDRLENASGSLPGCFYYILDPEDPSLNTVKRLALVTLMLDGNWCREISPLENWGSITAKDPNGGGMVACVQHGFHFTKKHIGRSLHLHREAYMVLMYGDDPRENWVIPVRAEVVADPSMVTLGALVGAPVLATTFRMAFADVKFPKFDAESPRWKT